MTENEKMANPYRMVLLAAERAKQLKKGAKPRVEPGVKDTFTAMEEVKEGKVIAEYEEQEDEFDFFE